MVGQVLMAKFRRIERHGDDDEDEDMWRPVAETWEENEETESCDEEGGERQEQGGESVTQRSEVEEWEEELEADIELERREFGQSPPEGHEDWADD